MGPTIKLVGFLLFVAGAGSIFYLQHCVSAYRSSVPKPLTVGPFTAIRASFRWMHDPSDMLVSEECLANLSRVKTAALITGMFWLILATFLIVARALDV